MVVCKGWMMFSNGAKHVCVLELLMGGGWGTCEKEILQYTHSWWPPSFFFIVQIIISLLRGKEKPGAPGLEKGL